MRNGLALFALSVALSGVATAGPVVRSSFERLRPGAVKPEGWLLDAARAVRDGYTGYMDEVDPEFARAWSADLRPRGRNLDWMAAPNGSWSAEGGAYWFDGLVRLAEQLDDPQLRELAKRRLGPVLDRMNAKGVLFNWWLNRDSDEERRWCYVSPAIWQMWAGGISERAVAAYLDVTGDVRAKRALAFAFDDPRLFTEASVRKAPAAQAVFEAAWLTGDPGVCATAEAAAKDPMPAFAVPPPADLTASLGWKRPEIHRARATRHGVTTAEALLSVLRAYRWSGERKYLDAVLAWFAFLDRHALQPYGVTVSDEEWGWAGPNRGSETCTVAAEPWTRTELMMVLGDGAWGDMVERAFFNAAPNCLSRDFRRHVYVQTANRTDAGDFHEVSAYRDFAGMKACPTRYRRKHYPLCCTAALNRLVPNYVQSMWMKASDGGVAATLYGPCRFSAQLADGVFEVRERTGYPHDERIVLEVLQTPVRELPLHLRIPGWCSAPGLKVGGEPVSVTAEKGFVRVSRVWKAGDTVELTLPRTPVVERKTDRNDAHGRTYASVSAGPVLFAWAVPSTDDDTPTGEVLVPSVGEAFSARDVSLDAGLRTLTIPTAKGDRLTLVPYAEAKLRVSMFPVKVKEKVP